jgi:hypothetical protein
MMQMMERMNFVMGNVCDRLDRVEKCGNKAGTSTQDVRKVGAEPKANSGSRTDMSRWANRRGFNMSMEEKRRLRVSNSYAHNAFMMLDKEREAKRLEKVYKETNKEHEEWRTSIQRQRDNKRKRTTMVIIQKYTCKQMRRHAYLKFLSTTIFIQCCYRQLRARKEL